MCVWMQYTISFYIGWRRTICFIMCILDGHSIFMIYYPIYNDSNSVVYYMYFNVKYEFILHYTVENCSPFMLWWVYMSAIFPRCITIENGSHGVVYGVIEWMVVLLSRGGNTCHIHSKNCFLFYSTKSFTYDAKAHNQ